VKHLANGNINAVTADVTRTRCRWLSRITTSVNNKHVLISS